MVVAIDGRSGAGKSHLAEQVARELGGATMVHVDNFYRDLADEERLGLSPEAGVDRFFDWQRMRREAIEPLRARRTAYFRPFDWDRGRLGEQSTTLGPASVVVVEGVYSARPELADLIDLAVLVTVDEAVSRARLAARHDPPAMASRWEAAEDVYFSRIRPPASFDVRVDGEGDR